MDPEEQVGQCGCWVCTGVLTAMGALVGERAATSKHEVEGGPGCTGVLARAVCSWEGPPGSTADAATDD